MSRRDPGRPITVMCVDDHRILRDGIALIISQQSDMQVVGSASSGEEAVTLFARVHPRVTLMDLQLPGMSGLDAIRQIKQQAPDACIVVLTMHKGDEDIYRALHAGVATYLLKDTLADDLVRVIREVDAGARPLGADIQALLEKRSQDCVLTLREFDVLDAVYRGQRNKEIAVSLGIGVETVRAHLKSIFTKLNVTDRTAAVNVALRRGIIHLG